MGNLRDQLKQAKILSDKEAKRLAHEERVRRKQVGREGLEVEEAKRRAEIERLRDEERERDRERQAQLDAERAERDERAACRAILESRARGPERRGTMRWYFETADGALPWITVGREDSMQLASGAVAIVRRGDGHAHVYALLPVELARRVKAVYPDRVVWEHRRL